MSQTLGGQKLICFWRRTKICNAIGATRRGDGGQVVEGHAGNAGVIINFVMLSVCCGFCRGLFVSCKQNRQLPKRQRICELFNKRFKGGSVTDWGAGCRLGGREVYKRHSDCLNGASVLSIDVARHCLSSQAMSYAALLCPAVPCSVGCWLLAVNGAADRQQAVRQ